MATEMGIVKTLIGTATATASDGSQRTLLVGDRVYADEIITTDTTSNIEIEFSDGGVLDLGKNSQTLLDNNIINAQEVANLAVDDDINAIQQALLRGEDPTQVAQATSAGTRAGTGANQGNEGITIVNTDYLAPEAVVTSGFETTGPARSIGNFEDFDLFEDVFTLTQSANAGIIDLTVSVDEDNTLRGSVLENPVDVNGLPLTVTEFTVAGITASAGNPVNIDNIGSLTIDPNGDLTFIPVANYNGTVPTATHTVTNGTTSETSTLRIIVNSVDDLFTDTSEAIVGNEDIVQTGSVLENSIDDNGLALNVTSFTIAGTNATAGNPVNIPNVGTLTIASNGDYTFTPVANYNGTVPTATYTVTNGDTTDQSTLDITVNPIPDIFADTNEAVSGDEDTTQAGSVLENSTDNNGLALTVTTFTVNGTNADAGTPIAIANVGTLTIASNGDYTFTPVANYNGTVPTATYTITNGDTTDQSTLDISVNPIPDTFTDTNEAVSGDENTTQTGSVLENPTDNNGLALTVTTFTVDGTNADAGTSITIANVGSLTIASNGDYTFTPVVNYSGTVPTATYTITNGDTTDQSTLDISVNQTGDSFSDEDETVSGDENTIQTGSVLESLADDNGLTLDVTTFTVNGTATATGDTPFVIANVGSLTILPNGNYTFTPVENFNGPVPAVTYTVTNGAGGDSDQSTLNIIVIPVTDSFTDGNESVSGGEDSTQTGSLLSNVVVSSITSFSVDGSSVDVPADGSNSININNVGTITIDSNGNYTFVPVTHYSGAVPPINYTATDGTTSDSSVLTVQVTPIADVPQLSVTVVDEQRLAQPPSQGLEKTVYSATGQDRALLESIILEDLTDAFTQVGAETVTQAYRTGGVETATSIEPDSIEVTTGLIYLEQDSSISFSGYTDDSLLIELGGKTLVRTTGDMWGDYDSAETLDSITQNRGTLTTTGLFVADQSGYYTLEIYVYNHAGPGHLSVNVSVNGEATTALGSADLDLYPDNAAINAPDNAFDDLDFDGQDTDGGFYSAESVGYAYTLNLDASLIDADGSEALSGISLTDLPTGTTITNGANADGTYNPGSFEFVSDHILSEAEINTITGSVTSTESSNNVFAETIETATLVNVTARLLVELDTSGDDIIYGGTDDRILTGGAGADDFIWTKAETALGAHDIVTDFNADEGDTLNLADLLSDGSHTIDGLAANDTEENGEHLQISIKDSSGDIVQTIDLTSVATENPVNTLNELLATDSINQGF